MSFINDLQNYFFTQGFNEAGGVSQGTLTPQNVYNPSTYLTASPTGRPASNYNTAQKTTTQAAQLPSGLPAQAGNNGNQNSNFNNSLSDFQNSQLSSINSGYDSYFQELDRQLNQDLPQQYANQQSIVENAYQQAAGNLDLASSQAETTNTKNLRSLAEDVRNSMRAGNVYLGARGASDSSAANQYAYAIGKEANKNRSNLMSNYANVQLTVATERKRLDSERTNNLLSVANWYSSAQAQLRNAMATGQISKQSDIRGLSQSMLNIALTQLQNQEAQYNATKNALMQWATYNSKTPAQLQQNLQAMSQYQKFNPSVSFGGNTNNQYYPGNSESTEKKDIFGNIIRF